jgi:hypothetical protein
VKFFSSFFLVLALGVLINAVEGKWALSQQPASSGQAVMNWVILAGLLYASYALWRRAEIQAQLQRDSETDKRILDNVAQGATPGEAVYAEIFGHDLGDFVGGLRDFTESFWIEIAESVREKFASADLRGAQPGRISGVIAAMMLSDLDIEPRDGDERKALYTAALGGYEWRCVEEEKGTPTSFILDAATSFVSEHSDPAFLLVHYPDLSSQTAAFMRLKGIGGLAEGSPGGALNGIRFLHKAQEYIVTNLPGSPAVDLDDARNCFLFGVALRDIERAAEALAEQS